MQSFGTASTLAGDDGGKSGDERGANGVIDETSSTGHLTGRGGGPLTEGRLRKVSATHMDAAVDGLKTMDHGTSEKSDQVAQKVLQIQQKARPKFLAANTSIIGSHSFYGSKPRWRRLRNGGAVRRRALQLTKGG